MTLTSRGRHFSAPQSYTSGATIIYSQVNRPSGCDTFTSTGLATTSLGTNVFENLGGCLQLTNIRFPEEKNAFVSHNATITSIDGSEFGETSFFYEDTTGYASMRGCGNSLIDTPQWNCHAALAASGTAVASVTLDPTAEFWPCDASAGPVTMTVPESSGILALGTYDVKKIDGSANACAIAMSGNDTLDGQTSYLLTALNQDLRFTRASGTSNWFSTPLAAPLAHVSVLLVPEQHHRAALSAGRLRADRERDTRLHPVGVSLSKEHIDQRLERPNYVYASLRTANAVTGTASNSGVVQITTTTNTHYSTGDQVFATCHGIGGTTEANVALPATINDNYTTLQHFTLIGSTYSHSFTSGGSCDLLGLTASNFSGGAHTTGANGVEVRTGTPAQTLVGLVYMDGSQNFNDSATKRDVASWFNRRNKTCIASWGADATVTGTSYAELTASASPLHCEFVAWANADQPWSMFGVVNDSVISEVASIAAGFDGTTPTAETISCGRTTTGNASRSGSPALPRSPTASITSPCSAKWRRAGPGR